MTGKNNSTRLLLNIRSVTLRVSFTWLMLLLLAACGTSTPPPTTPTSIPLAKEIFFRDWEGDMPQSVLDAFTAEYGIKVNYVIYESQEEAIEDIKAGQTYDVVVMESRLIPLLIQQNLLAQLDQRNLPNTKNLSASFRELAYDPGNRYSIPYSWGTTGLVYRSDLVDEPVTRWSDLWDPRYAGRVALWTGQSREVISLTLKSLGYSANSESPTELEAALERLLELKTKFLAVEDFDLYTSAGILNSGQAVIAMGYANDVLLGRESNPAISYTLPKEGALLWNDAFVIPANSPNKYTAELFLNFLLRANINAQVVNENLFATPNEAALPLIKTEILSDPVIFPANSDLANAELLLPLSPQGQQLYGQIWQRFNTTP